jgi:hypothetical protein
MPLHILAAANVDERDRAASGNSWQASIPFSDGFTLRLDLA